VWSLASGCTNANINCGTATITDAKYTLGTCTGTLYGDACPITCGIGYAGVVDDIVCRGTVETPAWTVPTGCETLTCPQYFAPLGYTDKQCNGTTYNSYCNMSCSTGYTGGVSVVSCTADASWSSATGCDPVDCSAWSGSSSYTASTCTGTTYTKKCSMSCAAGYHGVPTDSTCLSTGVWDVPSGCIKDFTNNSLATSVTVSMLLLLITMLL
jgi:hypothetical protein